MLFLALVRCLEIGIAPGTAVMIAGNGGTCGKEYAYVTCH